MDWTPGKPVFLETSHFELRSMTPADVNERYVEWWRDPEVMAGVPTPFLSWDIARHRQRIARQFDNTENFKWGIFDKTTGELIGFVAIFCNVGHRLATMNTVIGDKSYWGKKVLLELADVGMEFIFRTLGMEKIVGEAAARNMPTVYINKAMGLKVEGVLEKHWIMADGSRSDVLSFGLLREDWERRRRGGSRK